MEEARKNIWLVDSKVEKYTTCIPYSSYISSFTKLTMGSSIYIVHIIDYIQGLIVSSRKESLQAHKKPWAHEHEPVNNLLDTVKVCSMNSLTEDYHFENPFVCINTSKLI